MNAIERYIGLFPSSYSSSSIQLLYGTVRMGGKGTYSFSSILSLCFLLYRTYYMYCLPFFLFPSDWVVLNNLTIMYKGKSCVESEKRLVSSNSLFDYIFLSLSVSLV
mmetsp:Transcript_10359/g.10011  ORF Transcript_10359/g.10011 Transcript_10359/m.10011 type:complete len:107 (-) Transcript_10359:375-695(-)